MKQFVLAGFVVGLCGGAQAHEFVSVLDVLDEVADRPYECTGYDAATDSCTGLSIMEQEEGILYNTSWFAVANGTTGTPYLFVVYAEYELRMGWGCPLYFGGGVNLNYHSGGEPAMGDAYAKQIKAQIDQQMNSAYEPCAGYYRVGPGQYRVEYRYGHGGKADRAAEEVRFFPNAKRVRP